MRARRPARWWPVLLVAAATACTSPAPFAGDDEPDAGRGRAAAGPSTGSGAPAVPASVDLADVAVVPWKVRPADPLPEIKLTAARTVAYLMSWPDGGGGLDVAHARAAALSLDPALADPLEPWLEAADGTGVRALVDAAQYVGLEPKKNSAAVTVLVRQVGRAESTAYSRIGTSVTVRVELARQGGKWRVQRLLPTDGACPPGAPAPTGPPGAPAPTGPPAAPEAVSRRPLSPEEATRASELARALAEDPRLGLPAAARNDLLCDRIDPELLTLLDRLSDTYRIGVSVLRSGHPPVVFGTDKVTHHQRGRAVDVWAVNGLSVTNPQAAADVRGLVREAERLGANEIGAPVDVDGRKATVFTNALHHDHVHLAFELPLAPGLEPTDGPSGNRD